MDDWAEEFALLVNNHVELSEPESLQGQLAQLRAAVAELRQRIRCEFAWLAKELGL